MALLPLSMLAQTDGLYVGPGEEVVVEPTTDMFFAGVVMDSSGTPGTLTIRTTTGLITQVIIDGEILGDERINFDGPSTELTIKNGTWSVKWGFPNNDEELRDLFLLGDDALAVVPPSSSLTVNTLLDLDRSTTGLSLILQADNSGYGQLLTNQFIFNDSSLAEVEAQQYLTTDGTPGWRQLSFPVGGTLADLDDDLTLINPTNGTESQYNVFWYDARPLDLPNYNPTGGTSSGSTDANTNTATTYSTANSRNWTPSADTTEIIGPGNNSRAWNIYSGGLFPLIDVSTPGLIDVAGTNVGNGNYDFECYETHGVVFEAGQVPPSVIEQEITGWNLIPNPYPSNIETSTLLSDGFFSGTPATAYGAIHVWNPNGTATGLDQYMAITDGIATTVGWNTGNPEDTSAPNIAPFQAFWVKTAHSPTTGDDGGFKKTLRLTNAMRTVDDEATNYFKKAIPLIRLNILETNGKWADQAIVAFDNTSTIGIDVNDAIKFFSPNEEVPSLYTKINGKPITINRLPDPVTSYSLPLFLDSKKSGEDYIISMQDEDIDPSWTIHLEDKMTGEIINLRSSEYSFKHNGSINGNRFVVHINKFENHFTQNQYQNITVYGANDAIHVKFNNPDNVTAQVTISSIAGHTLYSGTVRTNEDFVFPTRGHIAAYAIMVASGDKIVREKIVQ